MYEWRKSHDLPPWHLDAMSEQCLNNAYSMHVDISELIIHFVPLVFNGPSTHHCTCIVMHRCTCIVCVINKCYINTYTCAMPTFLLALFVGICTHTYIHIYIYTCQKYAHAYVVTLVCLCTSVLRIHDTHTHMCNAYLFVWLFFGGIGIPYLICLVRQAHLNQTVVLNLWQNVYPYIKLVLVYECMHAKWVCVCMHAFI
jgi:hypothetical protein